MYVPGLHNPVGRAGKESGTVIAPGTESNACVDVLAAKISVKLQKWSTVAEQVEKVNPDLLTRDEQGKAYTVRYEAVNAMLLNEFLKQHRRVQEQAREIQQQKATISELKNGMETVVARVKKQDSRIQKVSARIEMGRPTSKVVLNRP